MCSGYIPCQHKYPGVHLASHMMVINYCCKCDSNGQSLVSSPDITLTSVPREASMHSSFLRLLLGNLATSGSNTVWQLATYAINNDAIMWQRHRDRTGCIQTLPFT